MTSNKLYRGYLSNISPDLRNAVLSRVWPLDRAGPPRKPETWEEVVGCVDQELDT